MPPDERLPASRVLSHLGVVKRGPDGQLIYDWARFDATVREIQAIGAVPVMSLTFVPVVLVKSPDPAEWSVRLAWDAYSLPGDSAGAGPQSGSKLSWTRTLYRLAGATAVPTSGGSNAAVLTRTIQ